MQDVDLTIVELPPDREEQALRLVLRELDEPQFREQVAMLRAAVDRKTLSGYRTWGAFRDQDLCAAMLVQVQPGRTAVLWPPRSKEGECRETAEALLEAGIAALAQGDTRMVQTLLPTDSGDDAEFLRAAGFRHLSDLLYLVCLAEEFPREKPSSRLRFVPYSAAEHARFARLVEATYEQTLDCPAVNGVRRIDDVLSGYRATGRFAPERWLFVVDGEDDVGCLILTDYPEQDTWELIYMGLLPAARRKGYGAAIACHAQWLAGRAGRLRLVTAADAANEPALKVYAAAGFQAWDRRSVFIRILEGSR